MVMGNSVALYNPPIRVAEEMAMLDVHLGRAPRRGLPGRHAHGHDLLLRREPGARCASKYREGVDLILQAWQSRSRSPSTASTRSCATSTSWPRPIQKPHPPVWIPGGGSVETWDWCAEHDFLYAYLSYFGYLRGRRT